MILFVLKVPLNNKQTNKQTTDCYCSLVISTYLDTQQNQLSHSFRLSYDVVFKIWAGSVSSSVLHQTSMRWATISLSQVIIMHLEFTNICYT